MTDEIAAERTVSRETIPLETLPPQHILPAMNAIAHVGVALTARDRRRAIRGLREAVRHLEDLARAMEKAT